MQINTPASLGVMCELTDDTLCVLIKIINKDVKQKWSQHRALRNTTCDRPPAGFSSTDHHSLGPSIQPVLDPADRSFIQAVGSQFFYENSMGNCVKCFNVGDDICITPVGKEN